MRELSLLAQNTSNLRNHEHKTPLLTVHCHLPSLYLTNISKKARHSALNSQNTPLISSKITNL